VCIDDLPVEILTKILNHVIESREFMSRKIICTNSDDKNSYPCINCIEHTFDAFEVKTIEYTNYKLVCNKWNQIMNTIDTTEFNDAI
jgi:hypothetical protein